MPKKEIDYSKTVIYKIVCNDLTVTDVYVGSTIRFTKRKCQHKNNSINCNKAASKFKIYKIIRDNGGWDNWSMIQIEEYPCANGNEARARERYFYEQLNATLNDMRPKLTEEEIENYHTISHKKQLELHPDYNKKRMQRRLELHPDINKKNYQRRLELHPGYNTTKYLCECGSNIRVDGKSKHIKSVKHQDYIKSLNVAVDA